MLEAMAGHVGKAGTTRGLSAHALPLPDGASEDFLCQGGLVGVLGGVKIVFGCLGPEWMLSVSHKRRDIEIIAGTAHSRLLRRVIGLETSPGALFLRRGRSVGSEVLGGVTEGI